MLPPALGAGDSGGTGAQSQSRMVFPTLPASQHVVEATTFRPAIAGDFTLELVSGPASREVTLDEVKREMREAYLGIEPKGTIQGERIFDFRDKGNRSRVLQTVAAIGHALDHPWGGAHYQPGRYIDLREHLDIVRTLSFTFPHNQFLTILVIYGFPGMILAMLLYLLVFRSLARSARMAARFPDPGAASPIAALCGALVAYLVNSQFHPTVPFWTDRPHFILIGLALAVQQELSFRRPQSSQRGPLLRQP